MSSDTERQTNRSYDSHNKARKHYTRRRIDSEEGREATVPVWEGTVGNDVDQISHHSGQGGDCHAVGRRNITPEHNTTAGQNPNPAHFPTPEQRGDTIIYKSGTVPHRFHCGICKKRVNNPTTSLCGHMFCGECIEHKLKEKPFCPTCNSKFDKIIRLQSYITAADPVVKCKRCEEGWSGYAKSRQVFRYLKKKGVKVSGTVLAVGNSIKDLTYHLLAKPWVRCLLIMSILLISLVYCGFLPNIKFRKFFVDLFYFIRDYDYLEPPEHGEKVTEHTTITEDKLPQTVGYTPEIGKTNCDAEDSIFKTFLSFIGLA